MCIADIACFITSTGHGEPAITPVRSDDRSRSPNCGWASSAMNIVGTPYSDVQRSVSTARNVASGSNAASGKTIVAPCVVQARLPSTMPKQWYSGTGMQTRSASV